MTHKETQKNKSTLFLFLPIFFLLFIGIFVSVIQLRNTQQTRTQASQQSCGVSSTLLAITQQEQIMYDEINKFRKENNVPPLSWDPGLIQASSWMSNDLYAHNSLSHTDSYGRTLRTRLVDCGLPNLVTIGEIVDSGQGDAQTVASAWEHSPAQNRDLLNKNYTQIGIGTSAGNYSQVFWTINFAAPNPTPTPTYIYPTTIYPTNITVTKIITATPTQSAPKPPTPTPIRVTVIATPTSGAGGGGGGGGGSGSGGGGGGQIGTNFPILTQIVPNPAAPNATITVKGTGGYIKFADGQIKETTAHYQMFLDGIPKGSMSCTSKVCQGFIIIPQSATLGSHIVSVEGGSKITLTVAGPTFSPPLNPNTTLVPTKPFTPTGALPATSPVPTIDPSFVVNPNDMQVFISAKVPGLGKDGNKSPKHLTRRIKATILGLNNEPVVTGTADLKFDGDLFRGIVHFGKVPNETYYMKVVGDRLLQAYVLPQFQQLNSSRLNIAPETTLAQGDLDLDNAVTILDYNIAIVCFQDRRCAANDGKTQDALDFNDDGVTDVKDYNLLLQSFYKYPGD